MNRFLLATSLFYCVLFGSPCFAEATKYEAESAVLEKGAMAETSGDASNGGYVKLNNGSITFSVSVEKKGIHTLTIHYQNNYGGSKINNINVNGVQVGSPTFEIAATFTDVETTAALNAGTNEVSITSSWGWIDVDYIAISEYTPEPFVISDSPVTANATESAKKLYNFLKENFGKKTISGIMTGDINTSADILSQEDVKAVYTAGGHYPALIGFDFLFATGPKASESWYQEYTNKTISLAEELWKKGGIPAFTWHWKDPSDQVDAFYVQGSGDPYTTFDFTKAFIPGTTEWDSESDTYKQMTEDLDHIASLFLQLQEADIAAIFRPIHESGGSWFWWSTHTGEEFAALYRLIYDRIVNKNGVKNLIWVFNPQDATFTSWDPGANYYDVLSVDIYNDTNNHVSNFSAFSSLKSKFGATKILALTENGPIPDVNNMYEDGATWSWWMPWYQTWNGGFISKTANSVWTSNLNDDRIITLDEMSGWESASDMKDNTQTDDFTVYPSLLTEELHIFCSKKAIISITDAFGRLISSSISEGGQTDINCSKWNSGIYFVHIINDGHTICLKVMK